MSHVDGKVRPMATSRSKSAGKAVKKAPAKAAQKEGAPKGAVSKTSKGFSIRTYETPAPDFDPRTASDRELLHYGLPSRPDAATEPELRALWDTAFSRPHTWITPEFIEVEGKTHGPAARARGVTPAVARGAAPKAVTNATSSNWSGSVAFAPSGNTYRFVLGQWTVPEPYAPGFGAFFASEWVGIDGWGSNDVLQAGTETEVIKVPIFGDFRSIYAWWEWFPAGEVAIGNLGVSAGDFMNCLICVNSSTSATVYFSNLSTNVSTTFTITAPQGTTLVGNSAEWIVERPTVNGSVASLTDYDVMFFDACIAGYSNGRTLGISSAGSATPVTMTGNGGASLSVPTFETSQLFRMDWKKAN
jgi:hypothetical protein